MKYSFIGFSVIQNTFVMHLKYYVLPRKSLLFIPLNILDYKTKLNLSHAIIFPKHRHTHTYKKLFTVNCWKTIMNIKNVVVWTSIFNKAYILNKLSFQINLKRKNLQNIVGRRRVIKNYQKESQFIVQILRISFLKREKVKQK